MNKKFTKEDFIEKAKKVHGDKYDYSKVEYIDSKHNVIIICPKHGEFIQRANRHLQGSGCKKCSVDKRILTCKLSTDEWIERAKKVHGNKYDYSKVEYKNNYTKVCIVCPIHGEFWMLPYAHVNLGEGCIKCTNSVKLTTDDFIEKAKKVHGDKYDYSKVEYVNNYSKVCIICPKHGEFWQTPNGHLYNFQGCPNCKKSRMEEYTKLLLERNDIVFEAEKTFDWLIYDNNMKLDFLCGNIAIECQGGQHFIGVKKYGGADEFFIRLKRDRIKYEKCKEHNIPILYIIPYRYRNTKVFNEFYKDKNYIFFKNIDKELTDRLREVL